MRLCSRVELCYQAFTITLATAFAIAQFVLLLFGSVLLALSLSQEMSPRCLQLAVQKTNGCSVPAGLWAPYKNTFTPACYKHDFCYFCGNRFRWTRTQCDTTFERDMHKLCENHSNRRKRLLFSKERRCGTAAKMYFLAPKTVGSRYWVKLSPPWCRDAENCGNPNISLR